MLEIERTSEVGSPNFSAWGSLRRMDAGVAWAAVGSIVAVFSLLVVVGQLRQTRIDRHDDYLRGLIPFVSIDLYDDGQGIGLIPVRVFAHGGGVAYNVGIN